MVWAYTVEYESMHKRILRGNSVLDCESQMSFVLAFHLWFEWLLGCL